MAKDVEITVHYAGKNIEAAFGESDRIEAEEQNGVSRANPSLVVQAGKNASEGVTLLKFIRRLASRKER